MELGLQGRVALVVGASRGIGRAIAEVLAREGAHVALCARGEAELEATVKALAAQGATVTAIAGDASTEQGAADVVARALAWQGRLEVLVNNAGGSKGSPGFATATAQQWREVLELNLLGAVWCSQHATQWMREHGGGAVVHVSSVCGREYCSSAPYSAAKTAMVALGKSMARDLAPFGIRVNTVAPGSILFPGGSWDARAKKDPERIEKMKREELPWGRFGTPHEVAEVVAFLCSERASWVTGACVTIDGGQGRAL